MWSELQGDIAIDDLDIWHGDCFNSCVCTFEGADICGWAISTKGGQFKWQRASGKTGSSMTGPTNDHTYGTPAGHYMFIETSVGSPGAQAYMYSPWYYNKAEMCVQFFYHMYGAQIGTLDVFIRPYRSRYMYRMFSLSGNQNNTWHLGSASVTRKGYFQIVVRGIKGQGYRGDIAVDDFRVRTGACPAQGDCDFEHLDFCSWSQETKDNFDWIIGSGRTSSVFTGNQGYDCNFDVNVYTPYSRNSSSKHFQWLRHTGATTSRQTGPNNDHTTDSDKGSYMYVDASYPAKTNDVAWLIQKNIKNTNGFCMSFWYLMYGPHVGQLNIWLQTPSKKVLKWKRSGSQGDEWKHGQISISRSEGTTLTVIMEAIRGKGYAGDIGIDDVSYKATDQGCPAERECTFESSSWSSTSPGLLCGWQQEKSKDDFDWSISTGGTASTKTGPKFDHTLQTKFGHYVYIESSYPRRDQAMMLSQSHKATPGQCFTFFYHKYGLTVSNLTLLMRIDNVDSPVWSRGEYNDGPFWHPALVTLKSPKKQFQLIFQAFVGSSYTGDIALDDLLLKDGECPAPGNCDFEGFGQCSYVQDASEDDFDWIRGHGGTNRWRTCPKVDHTKNSKTVKICLA